MAFYLGCDAESLTDPEEFSASSLPRAPHSAVCAICFTEGSTVGVA